MNLSIISKEIELVITNQIKKGSNLDGSASELSQTYKEELTPYFLEVLPKIEEEGILSHFMRPTLF